ncbi:MAG: tripartite tricarboxylate transporter substrate binding protein [Burkholderiales bacterium]|nr:tripartite tricarboxylate transporter substrate binding protein [Burkholderiales bacterium]
MFSLQKFARRTACVLMLAGAATAAAQTYPSKPVRVIVPYAAGGSTDSTARLIAQSLANALGQPFVVENRPGAGGTIGHEAVAKAAPDGYTLLFSAAGPLVVTPHTYPKLSYEPIKGFEPIKLVATAPLLFVVNSNFKGNSVADVIKQAQTAPGKLTYGSFGNGSAAHLAGELFKSLGKIDISHVPYKGSAPALTDLISGQIDMMFDVLVTALPHVKTGRLRPLAITSPQRASLLPDVPTMSEAGVAGFDAGTWFGLLAPAGVDRQVVETLSRALDTILQRPDLRDTLVQQGAVVAGGTPDAFKRFFAAEYDKWGKVVKAAGISSQ